MKHGTSWTRVFRRNDPDGNFEKHPLTKGVLFWYNEGINKKGETNVKKLILRAFLLLLTLLMVIPFAGCQETPEPQETNPVTDPAETDPSTDPSGTDPETDPETNPESGANE